jgi:hypothetical protein
LALRGVFGIWPIGQVAGEERAPASAAFADLDSSVVLNFAMPVPSKS